MNIYMQFYASGLEYEMCIKSQLFGHTSQSNHRPVRPVFYFRHTHEQNMRAVFKILYHPFLLVGQYRHVKIMDSANPQNILGILWYFNITMENHNF